MVYPDNGLPRFETAPNPDRDDAYCTPGDHRLRNLKSGICEWCKRELQERAVRD